MRDERTIGKELFGRWVRLALARWALHKETFFQTEAAVGVGHPLTAVRQELERLVGLGMLQRIDIPGGRRVHYQRTDSPLWNVIRATDDILTASGESINADEGRP